jgi:hypothetical protein
LATSTRPFVGAQSLWDQILAETGEKVSWTGIKGFRVTYRQDMRKRLGVWLSAGVERSYVVASGLSRPTKESVAVAILMDVSRAFETLQGSFPYRMSSNCADSSFSQEDLVSNLISLHTLLRPHLNFDRLCQPVSVKGSLEVWDRFGPVGATKNYRFTPMLHPCTECRASSILPELGYIQPAPKGAAFVDF